MTGDPGTSASVNMTMSGDGWCWETPKPRGLNTGYPGSIVKQPEHGEATVRPIDGLNSFAYRPANGFKGPDYYEFVFYGRVAHYLKVNVTVLDK